MLFILKVIAALILLAVVVIGIYILLQGKEEMFFEVTQRTKARLIKRSENKLEFEVELPMHNDGKEEGIILDAFIVCICRRNNMLMPSCADASI